MYPKFMRRDAVSPINPVSSPVSPVSLMFDSMNLRRGVDSYVFYMENPLLHEISMLISLYFYFFNFKIISKKTTLISAVFFPCKSKVENSKSTDQTQNTNSKLT